MTGKIYLIPKRVFLPKRPQLLERLYPSIVPEHHNVMIPPSAL